jgi:5-(carboxyamino)imidazole ribonucleotide mutase
MSEHPLVGIVMGSKSDYEVLSAAVEILRVLEIPHEARVLSAHRTPDQLIEYVETARARGLRVMIAGAGGAAHLAGVIAAKTLLPVLGVPIAATPLNGLDSLLSIVQMPRGVPVGTLAIVPDPLLQKRRCSDCLRRSGGSSIFAKEHRSDINWVAGPSPTAWADDSAAKSSCAGAMISA